MDRKLCSFLLLLAGLSGCGYSLRTSSSPLLEKEGVRRIYIAPLVNNSYRYGVQNLVYNSLLRALAGNRNLTFVSRPEDSDAILGGRVENARYDGQNALTAKDLQPAGLGTRFANLLVNRQYVAVLECSFSLNRTRPLPGKVANLWSGSFSRTKIFPAANQLGPTGTTSALINESEFERALGDIASEIMVDVRENMLARF